MKRILLVCLILVGLTGLVASVWLRINLSRPGVSPLTDAVADPQQVFAAAMLAQSIATALWLPLFAALAGLVAGNLPGRIAAGGALVVGGLSLGVTVISWTGTPSLAAPALLWLMAAPGPQIIGLTLGLLSAAALLTGAGQGRTAAVTVMSLTVAVLVGLTTDLVPSPAALALPAAALAGLAAFRWRHPSAAWVGPGALILAALTLHHAAEMSTMHDTYVVVSHVSTAVTAWSLFLALASLATWLRPRLPLWLSFATAAVLGLAIFAATSPLLFLGGQGMPRRYIDYPDVFALWNLVSTVGATATLVIATMAAAAMILRRSRAP